jgi:dipeptidyl-peptidase-3
VDECRAECIGAYFMSDMELLALLGYTEHSPITGQDREFLPWLLRGTLDLCCF